MSRLNNQKKEVVLRDQQAFDYDQFWLKTRGPFWIKSQIKTVLYYLKAHSEDIVLDGRA